MKKTTTPRRRCEWCYRPFVMPRHISEQKYCSVDCAQRAVAPHDKWLPLSEFVELHRGRA